MCLEIMEIILKKIKEYNRILIFRHKRMDGDCVGASKGLKEILKQSFPEKEVLIPDNQHSDFLAFLGPDDGQIPEGCYADALGIVVDTGTAERISNPKFRLCKELVKIDHHIPVDDYADFTWVKECSSACEMVAQFYAAFQEELKISKEAATYLYTGMVTDSGQFQYRGVSGDTMRLAGLMLDQGIDTEHIFSNLNLRGIEEMKFKAQVYQDMSVTENGVAYIYVSREMKQRFRLSDESVGDVVTYLENIRGCLCWLAFIENDAPDSTIRVRLRSRYVAVNPVAEKYRGGGHAFACGATAYGQEEVFNLIRDADALLKEYKETHEDWL